MTTISTPITGTTSATSSRPKSHLWIALGIVVVGLAMLAVATLAIVRSTNAAPAVNAVHVAAGDPVAHGTTGNLATTDGVRITSVVHKRTLNEKQAGYNYMGSYGPGARATTASETDLLVHGGPGSAVTASGERLR